MNGEPRRESASAATRGAAAGAPPHRRTFAEWFFRTSALTLLREWRSQRRASRGAAPDAAATALLETLPASLTELVRETAARTRLRRSERKAIETELAAHMHDALASGKAPEAIASEFGEPRRVAPAFRRAAIKKRSPADRLVGRSLRVSAALLVVGGAFYLLAAIRLWMTAPAITFDPVERLRSLLPEDSGKPAWPEYRAALRWHKLEEWAARSRDSITLSVSGGEPGGSLLVTPAQLSARVTAEDLAAARDEDIAVLRAHREQIDRLRAAASMPVLGVDITPRLAPDDAEFFALSRGPEAAAAARSDAEALLAKSRSAGGDPAAERAEASAPALTLLIPWLAELRRAARLLAADATLAIEEGDGDRAVEDFAAMVAMAGHAEETRLLISQLVGSALRAMAAWHVAVALETSPEVFSDAALRRLSGVFAAVPDSAWRLDLAAERVGFEDMVQRLYSDDGQGGGLFLPAELAKHAALVGAQDGEGLLPAGRVLVGDVADFLAGPIGAAMQPSRRRTMEDYDRLIAAVEAASARPLEDSEAVDSLAALEQEILAAASGSAVRPRSIVSLLAPAFSTALRARRLGRTHVDAALVAIALELARRERGAYPEDLAALVPDWLAAIPIDPFDGAPLRFELRDGRPWLWSVGPDRVDDRGALALELRPQRGQRQWGAPGSTAGGDWVFLPVALPEDDEGASGAVGRSGGGARGAVIHMRGPG
ncbi:MAG TPA: hypothetical protein PKC43_12035 [Phycisphaerales bacterium]|nr:hypothetical protein [Phycisphaerales bacterium]HMP38161.1 hypothetical protein [Phycisphaerales bacterium]